MKALVISGGGSKGAFAGGVAQHLIEQEGKKYDMFLGTSTGSLLIPHLATGNIGKLYDIYTHVNQNSIFSINPFVIKKKGDREYVSINYFNTALQFIKRKRTFGESKNLKKHIKEHFTKAEYDLIKATKEDVVVTVTNLSKNRVEYKSINDYSYEEFCDWIWISCNLVPFMSLATKNGFEYADGGLGCVVPIREAILRGATEVDAIILATEVTQINRLPAKNPFSLMMDTFDFMLENVERHNITIGKLSAKQHGVKLNLYYTPTVLTTNSLVFDKEKMKKWWKSGYKYAKKLDDEKMSEFRPEMIDNKEIEEGLENA